MPISSLFGEERPCHGGTMSWLEACILDEEQIFDAREERIKQYSSADLDNIRKKVKGEIPLKYDGSDLEIVYLLAYYDRLEMYMLPRKHDLLTNFQIIDARRNILSSTATTEIETLVTKYEKASLPEVEQEKSIGLFK